MRGARSRASVVRMGDEMDFYKKRDEEKGQWSIFAPKRGEEKPDPPWLAKALMKLSPVLAALGKIVNTAGPPLILAWKKAVKIYKVLPSTAVSSISSAFRAFVGVPTVLYGGRRSRHDRTRA